ncbi:MAG: hypothetical protein JEY91_10970 [Spirochaetaceae bacterium]|nr:hypothetical protein [Spirochaetaceae bacterium]
MSAQVPDESYDEGFEIGFEDDFKKRKQNSLILLFHKRFGISEDVRKLILSEKDSAVLNHAIEAILESSPAEEVESLFR